jgi:prepilin-type N-terminal cleavage/methylation domain-containing protein
MTSNSFSKKNRGGFTLVEILVVIAVIGLLSSIIFAITRGADEQGRIAKSLHFSQHLQNSLGTYAAGIWSFDEGAAGTCSSGKDVCDVSGWGNDGTISGANYTTDAPSGTGYALSFNGVSDYISVSKVKDLGETTVTLWFNTDQPNQTKGIIDFRPGLSYGSFNFNWTGDGRPLLYLNSSNYRYFSNISEYMDGKWHFLVLYIKGDGQYDIGEATLSIDTTNIGLSSVSNGNSPLGWTGLRIGMSDYGYFSGLIDEVCAYSTSLSLSRVRSQYYAGLERLLAVDQITEQEYQGRLVIH